VGGFFKMSKDLFDDLFDNVLEYRLMSLILRNVVYQEEGTTIEGVHVKRGQWIRSYRKLAEDLKYKERRGYKQYSHQAIQKALKRLEQRGYIKIRAIQLTDKLTSDDSYICELKLDGIRLILSNVDGHPALSRYLHFWDLNPIDHAHAGCTTKKSYPIIGSSFVVGE
jgi:hypothetical protein